MDSVIDYPHAKIYAFEMFDRLKELDIISENKLAKYKRHVENLMTEDDEVGEKEQLDNDL